jgi:hypothetical protein
MSLFYAYKSRGISKDITILDADGSTVTPGDSDKVRAIIGRADETAKLTITSGEDTSNGSSFTKGSTNRLRIDASDLDFAAGVYTLMIDFYDAADSNEWKTVSRQVFCLEDT